jgi:hypothetical protein
MSTQKTSDETQASAANGGESDDVTAHSDPGTPITDGGEGGSATGTPITVGGDGGSASATGTPITVGGDGGQQQQQQQ